MKIIFAIKALANPGGGAEKVLAQVASGLACRGHDVAILTSDARSSVPYYPISDEIRLLRTGIGDATESSGFFEALQRMWGYGKSIRAEKPDVVVAFMHSTFVPVGIALLGSRIPVVASEHIGPEHYASRPVQSLLLQAVPLLTKRITVVSAQIYHSFGLWLRKSMVVMPNPVAVEQSSTGEARVRGDARILLSVGRLAAQKDQTILIDAFARIASKHPRWILRIVGEGNLREALEQRIHGYGLDRQIQMPGAVSAIDAEYEAADLFVLPSRYESFGLATAEALLHGVPAIGFADCSGTNELIVDNVNGRLVRGPNRVEALSCVIDEMMSNENERKRLANAPIGELTERFGLEGVLDRWERLLADVVGGRSVKAAATGDGILQGID